MSSGLALNVTSLTSPVVVLKTRNDSEPQSSGFTMTVLHPSNRAVLLLLQYDSHAVLCPVTLYCNVCTPTPYGGTSGVSGPRCPAGGCQTHSQKHMLARLGLTPAPWV